MIITYKKNIIIDERRDNIEIKIIGADTPEGTKIKKDLKKIAKKGASASKIKIWL